MARQKIVRKLQNYTADQNQSLPAGSGALTGTIVELVGRLFNLVKGLKGTTNAWDAPPLTLQQVKDRNISTSAPLTGGGNLSADRTLDIAAATGLVRGSMSASDKTKLDGIEAGATADQIAAEVPYSGSTALSSTNVEDALDELDTEKSGTGHTHTNISLDNLSDVVIASPALNQILQFNGTSWVNASGGGGGGGAIDVESNNVLLASGITVLDFSSIFTLALDGTTEVNISLSYGTTSGTVAQGNDDRFSNYYTFSRPGSLVSPITGTMWEPVMEARTLKVIQVELDTAVTVDTVFTIMRRSNGGTAAALSGATVTVLANQKNGSTTGLSNALAAGDALRCDVTSGGTSGQNAVIVCKAA